MSLSKLALSKTVENIESLDVGLPKAVWYSILHSLVPLPKNWSIGDFMMFVNQAYKFHHKEINTKDPGQEDLSMYRCTLLDVTIEVMYLFQRSSMEYSPEFYLNELNLQGQPIYVSIISTAIINKIHDQHFGDEPSPLVDIINTVVNGVDPDVDYDLVHQHFHTIMSKAMRRNKELTYTNAGLDKYHSDLLAVVSEMIDVLKPNN